MVTWQIFKSHMLTFACDTCKLTRVCEVIVELYRRWTSALMAIVQLRHTVVCQRPRKLGDAQVCYLREPPLTPFQPIIV